MRKCLLHEEFRVVLRICQWYNLGRQRSLHYKSSLQFFDLFILLKVHNFSIDVSFVLQIVAFFLSFHVDSFCQRTLIQLLHQCILIRNCWVGALVSALLVHISLGRLPCFGLFLHEFEVHFVGVIRHELAFRCRVRIPKSLHRVKEDSITIDSIWDFDNRCYRYFSVISLSLNWRIILDSIADLVLIGASTISLILMELCFNDNEFILLLLFKLVKFLHFYFESIGSAASHIVFLINLSKYVGINVRLCAYGIHGSIIIFDGLRKIPWKHLEVLMVTLPLFKFLLVDCCFVLVYWVPLNAGIKTS